MALGADAIFFSGRKRGRLDNLGKHLGFCFFLTARLPPREASCQLRHKLYEYPHASFG